MKKLKVFFEAACSLKAKFPLGSFILMRLVTMLVILFLLGWALFALMALAPGDIVDQMMQQQIMSQTSGTGGNRYAGVSYPEPACRPAEPHPLGNGGPCRANRKYGAVSESAHCVFG